MKKMKSKMFRLFQTTALILVIAVSLIGCGKKTDKELQGFYESNQNTIFTSAYPQYTYKQATFGLQTIEVYSDNTYCLTNTNSMYSGELLFNDDGTHEEVPRGAEVVKFYGSLTTKEEEGLLTLTLSKPTAIIGNLSFATNTPAAGYVNTNAWTDEMGTAAGGEEGALTKEAYLDKVAFSDTEIIVDTTSSTFEYVDLSGNAE